MKHFVELLPQITFVLCIFLHATEEYKKGLAPYLEKIVGFRVEKWLDKALYVLAVSVILVPFALVSPGGILSENVAKSFVIGGLLGDALSTHWLPSIKWRWSPGSLSALLYPYLAFALYNTTDGFVTGSALLGGLAFIGLWPMLWVIKFIIKLPLLIRWKIH